MTTECREVRFDFQPLGSRGVTGVFGGGTIASDGGGLLLREVEARTGLLRRLAECFDDFRDPERIEFSVEQLLKQRIYGLCLGYEDLNDHDQLRHDPLLAVLVDRVDPMGQDRLDPRDRGAGLAGKSTLNRLELTPAGADATSRYQKIVARHERLDRFFVEAFMDLQDRPLEELVLDLDATDDPVHGHQLGRFFHGYYDGYCYLPLYIFCGESLLCAKLRPADIDAAAGSVKQVARIVEQIRARWPSVRILVRGDSGFCREPLMRWCEANGVDFLFGLAKNKRLLRAIGRELQAAGEAFAMHGEAVRTFAELTYRTRKSWSRERRVVAKAEHLAKGSNPRFIVTSLSVERYAAQALYEDVYCARGEMENRIKEQQLCLFADRTSCRTMRANQLRLWLSSAAYVLLQTLRRHALRNTPLERARCDTIRLKLFKIGVLVRTTVRRIWFSWAESYPYHSWFAAAWENLQAWRPPPTRAAPA
jgi:hypothetical protein